MPEWLCISDKSNVQHTQLVCAKHLPASLLPLFSNSGGTVVAIVVGGMVAANVVTVVENLDLRNQKVLLTGANVGRGIVTIGAEGR